MKRNRRKSIASIKFLNLFQSEVSQLIISSELFLNYIFPAEDPIFIQACIKFTDSMESGEELNIGT